MSMFTPKVAAPAQAPPTPMPIEDSEAGRRERLRTMARASQSGGRQSTFGPTGRQGDTSQAETRAGFGSTILTG